MIKFSASPKWYKKVAEEEKDVEDFDAMGKVFNIKSTKWFRFKFWLKDATRQVANLKSYIFPRPLKSTPLTDKERELANRLLIQDKAMEYMDRGWYSGRDLIDFLTEHLELPQHMLAAQLRLTNRSLETYKFLTNNELRAGEYSKRLVAMYYVVLWAMAEGVMPGEFLSFLDEPYELDNDSSACLLSSIEYESEIITRDYIKERVRIWNERWDNGVWR